MERTSEATPTERRADLRVPAVTAWFWILKGLSTALGESTSDFLVHRLDPPTAVVIGLVVFVAALGAQLVMRRYWAPTYWFAVVGVGVFGTMAADVVHVAIGVPYVVSVVLGAGAMAVVFVCWHRSEGTLSIHSIDSTRRELFYWATVVVTFALGTAIGDLTAVTFGLGYLVSAALFAALILVPALGYRFLRWSSVGCFWAAYVLTRPLGASLADWMGKSPADGGLGWGSGPVSLVLAVIIAVGVGIVTVRRTDVQVPAAS